MAHPDRRHPSRPARRTDVARAGAQTMPWEDVTFTAPIPCATACPYWLDDLNTDLDGDDKEEIYFQACASPDGTGGSLEDVPGLPYQEGSVFDDVLIGPAPEGARLLELELRPAIDWDGFVCDPETGGELAILANGLHAGQCAMQNPNWPLPFGCMERGNIEVTAGKRYVFRAYNWSDGPTAPGRYRFRSA